MEAGKRDVEECPLVIKSSFQDNSVEVRIPPEHVTKGLVSNYHPGKKTPACSSVIELTDQVVDQPGNIGKKTAVMPEEWSERLGNGENELPMWEIK